MASQISDIAKSLQCPLKADPQKLGTGSCVTSKCAWWLGEGCAIAYVGANCKNNIRVWREKKDE